MPYTDTGNALVGCYTCGSKQTGNKSSLNHSSSMGGRWKEVYCLVIGTVTSMWQQYDSEFNNPLPKVNINVLEIGSHHNYVKPSRSTFVT